MEGWGVGDGKGKATRAFWIVAILSLVWNAFGCLDFTMTLVRSPAYLAAYPESYVAYLDTFPLWLMGAWALGVFGALAGSLLLLLRSSFAVLAFGASLVGLVATTQFQITDTRPAGLEAGTGDLVVMGLVWVMASALLAFALVQRRRGVLR